MLRTLTLFAVILLSIGCAAGGYKVSTRHDDFDGHDLTQMCVDVKGGPGFPAVEAIQLCTIRVTDANGTIRYSLDLVYAGDGWLFINDGESLVFLVDGERLGLSGEGSAASREVLDAGVVRESAHYDISVEALRRIGRAKAVRMKVVGSKGYLERYLPPESISNVARFVAEYVK